MPDALLAAILPIILAWDRHQICWIAYLEAWHVEIETYNSEQYNSDLCDMPHDGRIHDKVTLIK